MITFFTLGSILKIIYNIQVPITKILYIHSQYKIAMKIRRAIGKLYGGN